MSRKILSLLFIFGFSIAVIAKTTTPAFDLAPLNQATAKYRSAKMVQVDVEKTVKSELTGREAKYKGVIYLSSGMFRMVNSEPDKSVLVFDGSTIWNEQAASADFPGPVQVTKSRLSGKSKSQALFANLLTKDPVTKNFKVMNVKKENGTTIYEGRPLNTELNVQSMSLKIATSSKLVTEISYTDDIGNLTVMKFKNPQFKKSIDKKMFQYKPPKGAQVNEL